MLVKVNFQGNPEDISPKLDRMSKADQDWIHEIFDRTPVKQPLKMDLEEIVRFLTLFNDQERIFFEVR